MCVVAILVDDEMTSLHLVCLTYLLCSGIVALLVVKSLFFFVCRQLQTSVPVLYVKQGRIKKLP